MAQWDPTEFQQAVNDFLARQEWTQADLARAAGISPGVVNRWMQPPDSPMLVRPSDPTLRKIAPVMRVSLNHLMRLVGRAEPERVRGKQRPQELETLIADIEAGWLSADEVLRQVGSDAVRAIFRIHGERRPSHRRTTRRSPPESDPTWAIGLTPA